MARVPTVTLTPAAAMPDRPPIDRYKALDDSLLAPSSITTPAVVEIRWFTFAVDLSDNLCPARVVGTGVAALTLGLSDMDFALDQSVVTDNIVFCRDVQTACIPHGDLPIAKKQEGLEIEELSLYCP